MAEPDVEAALEDRPIGGLGLFFMRKLMDDVRFHWSPEQGNILTMVKLRQPRLHTQRGKPGYLDLFDLGERTSGFHHIRGAARPDSGNSSPPGARPGAFVAG